MSEFSDSYHLFVEGHDEGIALLKRAQLRGFVYPPSNGWVTILPEGTPFFPNQQLILANTGLLVHFVNAEDHGWGFEVYDGQKQVSRYECQWPDDLEIVDEVDLPAMRKAMGERLPQLADSDADRLFRPNDVEDIIANNPSQEFGEWLGLRNYAWTSYDYMAADFQGGQREANGVVQVT